MARKDPLPTLPSVTLQFHAHSAFKTFLDQVKSRGVNGLTFPENCLDSFPKAEKLNCWIQDLRRQFFDDREMSVCLRSFLDSMDASEETDRLRAIIDLYAGEDSYPINYYGVAGTIDNYAYTDILKQNNNSQNEIDLKGKVVFVGALEFNSAQQKDYFHTVFDRDDGVFLTGVEIAATAYANVASGHLLAELRLVLKVEVAAGNEHTPKHAMPALWSLLERLRPGRWPTLVRGDAAWGSEAVMSRAEQEGLAYLFKLRATGNVRRLIEKAMGESGWRDAGKGWQGKEAALCLVGWSRQRRVVVLRRRLKRDLAVVEGAR